MVFRNDNLIFVDGKILKREGKNDLHFIEVHDPTTFETDEFFMHSDTFDIISDFKNGEKVIGEFVTKGKFTSLRIKKKS